MPRVTVLMPVYNAGPYLRPAIQSILDQTYTDWQLLVLDDASTDKSAEVARSFRDPRITVRVNRPNLGLAGNLNLGLSLCETEYLARMDQDDLSRPGRLGAQVAWLDGHPETGILGTGLRTIGSFRNRTVSYPNDDGYLKSQLFFHCALAHPTLMFRMGAFRQHGLRYDAAFEKCEDYDLWTRAMEHVGLGVLEEVLFTYRIHQTNMSRVTGRIQTEKTEQLRLRMLARILPEASERERIRHLEFCRTGYAFTLADLTELDAWHARLAVANRARGSFPAAAFERVLSERWKAACAASTQWGQRSLSVYQRSPRGGALSVGEVLRWRTRALIRWGHPFWASWVERLRKLYDKLRRRGRT